MTNKEKIVTQIPVLQIWTDKEDIFARRERYLTSEDIKEILQKNPIEFVIADY